MTSSLVDHSAIVKPGAVIGKDCKIGPFCIVGPNVVLGDGCELKSHVVIEGKTSIGDDSIVYPFAVLGEMSQDLKWQNESAMTGLRIGKRCKIREYVTIHSGTPASDGTEIGDDCQIMVNAHVGHDCKIGNHVVLSNGVQVAGHVVIEDYARLSGGVMVSQFVRIGRNAFIAGMSGIVTDVVPYSIYDECSPHAFYRTVNLIGLEREGFSGEDIRAISKVFRSVFERNVCFGLSLKERLNKIRENFKNNKYAMDVIDFIENRSRMGVIAPVPPCRLPKLK